VLEVDGISSLLCYARTTLPHPASGRISTVVA
jgi:hypothetical protein